MQRQGQIVDGKIEYPDRAKIAIARLQEFEPPEGYYLAFSGGKDSIVIYDLAVKSGVKFDAHYSNTTVDPPELVQFIKSEYPNVEIHRPAISMWQAIVKHTSPPLRTQRYCCGYLKETGGNGRRVVTGIRWAESNKRAGRRMIEDCNKKSSNKTFLHPIIDWSSDDVWDYIHQNNMKYSCLYDEGYKRIGCIMCPMQGTKGMLKDAERWPKYYNAYLLAYEKMLKRRDELGKETIWRDAQQVLDWWIYNPPKGDPDQGVLFE